MGNAYPFQAWAPNCLPGGHWPNLSHGHRLYRGVGGINRVDFDTPVGFAQAEDSAISLVGIGHATSTRYTYALRPVAGTGWLESDDISCVCEVETDADGDWVGNRPGVVSNVTAEVLSGGQVKIRWSYRTPTDNSAPSDFGVYYATSNGITAGSPQTTETYAEDGRYSKTVTLSGGTTYWFAVTARAAGGVESRLSDIIGPVVADSTAPTAPAVTITRTF